MHNKKKKSVKLLSQIASTWCQSIFSSSHSLWTAIVRWYRIQKKKIRCERWVKWQKKWQKDWLMLKWRKYDDFSGRWDHVGKAAYNELKLLSMWVLCQKVQGHKCSQHSKHMVVQSLKRGILFALDGGGPKSKTKFESATHMHVGVAIVSWSQHPMQECNIVKQYRSR
jgi:hypothetical protein